MPDSYHRNVGFVSPLPEGSSTATGYSASKRPHSSYGATGRVMCDSAEQYTRCVALT